jgi:hypothetical protein
MIIPLCGCSSFLLTSIGLVKFVGPPSFSGLLRKKEVEPKGGDRDVALAVSESNDDEPDWTREEVMGEAKDM